MKQFKPMIYTGYFALGTYMVFLGFSTVKAFPFVVGSMLMACAVFLFAAHASKENK